MNKKPWVLVVLQVFVPYRGWYSKVCTCTCNGYGLYRYRYGLGKSYLQYTHAEPYSPKIQQLPKSTAKLHLNPLSPSKALTSQANLATNLQRTWLPSTTCCLWEIDDQWVDRDIRGVLLWSHNSMWWEYPFIFQSTVTRQHWSTKEWCPGQTHNEKSVEWAPEQTKLVTGQVTKTVEQQVIEL
jgi:hypothetical protein